MSPECELAARLSNAGREARWYGQSIQASIEFRNTFGLSCLPNEQTCLPNVRND
jgi:hypothetical protein